MPGGTRIFERQVIAAPSCARALHGWAETPADRTIDEPHGTPSFPRKRESPFALGVSLEIKLRVPLSRE
jgi:hypothetical protein